MKKLLALGLAAAMTVTGACLLASCKEGESFKVGFIALHNENSTYDKNFLDAIKAACEKKDVELVIKTDIPEDNACYDAAADLVDQGCDVIFADSFGHEEHVLKAAKEFPLVEFCHATGTMAHTEGVANFHNAFAHIYQGRYLAGVAAGMKLVEMYEAGELKDNNFDTNGNIKIGYVGAYTYAEVISGYTSFFLGAQSVVEEETDISVSMEVTFTGSWYDEGKEKEGANTLINNGAALISQHADSMGAPSACEDKKVPNVSYNGSTEDSCPNTFIISSYVNWEPYFEYMIEQAQGIWETRQAAKAAAEEAEEEIDLTTVDVSKYAIDNDWTGTLADGSVALTELGAAAADGTAEKIKEVKAQLEAGTLHVFDCSKFTVTVTDEKNVNAKVDENGHLISYMADVDFDTAYTPDHEVVENGVFYESKYRTAPYFDIQIDGITLLNAAF